MRRRVHRPFARERYFADSPSATGIIKLGWKVPGNKGDRPVKLPGFLVCSGSVDTDGRQQIDMPVMSKLGFGDREGEKAGSGEKRLRSIIERLSQSQKSASYPRFGELPTDLYVAIGYDSIRKGDTWEYPNTYVEEYSLYDNLGLKCQGDGEWAHRREKDGTRKKIVCRVRGCELADGEQYCPFSVEKKCRPHGRLVVRLATIKGDKYVPLSGVANASYRLDTGSDYGLSAILSELDRVSDKLRIDRPDGTITAPLTGLVATLSVRLENKRYRVKEGEGSVARVPQLKLVFDETLVLQREQQIYERAAATNGRLLESVPVEVERKQLEAEEQQPPRVDENEDIPYEDGEFRDVTEEENGNPELGHADFELEPAEEESEYEPPELEDVELPDLNRVKAGELWERCQEIASDHKCSPSEVLTFYANFGKGGVMSSVEDFFRFESDDPKRHERAMDHLYKTHERACSRCEEFLPGVTA